MARCDLQQQTQLMHISNMFKNAKKVVQLSQAAKTL